MRRYRTTSRLAEFAKNRQNPHWGKATHSSKRKQSGRWHRRHRADKNGMPTPETHLFQFLDF